MARAQGILGHAASLAAIVAGLAVVAVAAMVLVQGYSSVTTVPGEGGEPQRIERTEPAVGPALLTLLLFLPAPVAIFAANERGVGWAAPFVAALDTGLVFLLGLSIGGPQLWTSLPLVWFAAVLALLGSMGRPRSKMGGATPRQVP